MPTGMARKALVRVFTGYDKRESIGWHVFTQSLLDHSPHSEIRPITGQQRDGTNAFTYGRFLVPWMCDYRGYAIFVDGADMLLKDDITKILDLADGYSAVQVVKHQYQTRHPRKYVGTSMECDNDDYPCKNWSSVVLWWCGHHANRILTPEYVSNQPGSHLHRFRWLEEGRIGELPAYWGWIADEYGENKDAKLLHWTAGLPGFKAYVNAPHADDWYAALDRVTMGLQNAEHS